MLRRPFFWIILLLLAGVGGGGYYYYTELLNPSAPETTREDVLETATARRGDLEVLVNGIGTLQPANEVALSFRSSGTVTELNVQVGTEVSTGDLLAAVDDTDIRLQVLQAGIDLREAEMALDELYADPDAATQAAARGNLASAQAALEALVEPPSEDQLAAAEADLLAAEQSYNALFSGPSADENTTLQADLRVAEISLQQAQSAYNQVAWRNDVGMTTQAANLQAATIAYEKTLAQYNISIAGPEAANISAARANVAQARNALDILRAGANPMDVAAAEARVDEMQALLDDLLNGPSAEELESAQMAVQQARNNLESAMLNLEGAVIKAPVDGVVTAVEIQVGEASGTASVITLAERESSQFRFWIEELDAAAIAIGNPVKILFEAQPDVTFNGEILRIEPTLVDVEGASAVQVWASIDLTEHPVTLLYGMAADVEITAGKAQDAVLVPVQALREIVPGSYAVFVVDEAGELVMQPVQVGLQDFVSAEILSGLDVGTTVSTGAIPTQ